MQKVGLILLAAGESKRLGTPKQLLEFNDKSLIRLVAETALASVCAPVCVVLGANAEKCRAEIEDLPLEIVVNENWQNGMSSSLQTGLKKLLEIAPKISGALVLLGDQPLINAKIINSLAGVFNSTEKLIVASEYAETFGVPAVFSHQLFDELLQLSAAEGAKNVIKKHPAETEKIAIPEAEIDIDTPEDYQALVAL